MVSIREQTLALTISNLEDFVFVDLKRLHTHQFFIDLPCCCSSSAAAASTSSSSSS
jgi:hypothetical protein